MKTNKTISLFLFTFLMGLTTISFSQGIENNNGGFIQSSSTNYIKFGGSGDMTLSGTTADQIILGNMKVDFSSSTYKLTIPNDSYVTVNGDLTLADSLLLEANNSANMASLICNGSVSGGKAIVKQHISTDQWHMISSPVASALSGVYTGVYLYKWNEPDSIWAFITSASEPLTVARGYHAYSASTISGPTDVVFTGLLNTGDYSPTITYNTGTDKGEGWNELGNPYPSALEWNSSWTKTNVDATIYIYDGTQYKTWNYVTGLGGLGNGEIPPTQGFWVKANASNPSITIPNAERIHSSNTFYKGGNNTPDIISITLTGNGFTDEMFIGILSGATNGFDSDYDAYKLFGIEDAPQLYSIVDGTKLTVNLLAEITESITILLGLKVGTASEYTFEVDDFGNFDPSISVWLKDKLSGGITDLKENPVYDFYTDDGIYEDRFELHFKLDITATDLNDSKGYFRVYSFENSIFINNQANTPGQIFVYDMLGKEISQAKLYPGQLNKIHINNGRGYYVVKVVSGSNFKTEKVLIR